MYKILYFFLTRTFFMVYFLTVTDIQYVASACFRTLPRKEAEKRPVLKEKAY